VSDADEQLRDAIRIGEETLGALEMRCVYCGRKPRGAAAANAICVARPPERCQYAVGRTMGDFTAAYDEACRRQKEIGEQESPIHAALREITPPGGFNPPDGWVGYVNPEVLAAAAKKKLENDRQLADEDFDAELRSVRPSRVSWKHYGLAVEMPASEIGVMADKELRDAQRRAQEALESSLFADTFGPPKPRPPPGRLARLRSRLGWAFWRVAAWLEPDVSN